ncbi:MAG: hypothetical protein HUU19_02570 [Phycisphaerales bacterium]|nr:hypothetical protein [Phycisphaerales bacterium]
MTAAVIAGLLSSSALASIKVEFRTTGSFTDITNSSAVSISGTNVTINTPSSGTYRISRTDAGNLGVVTFASASKTINLLLSASAEDFDAINPIASAGCTDWGGDRNGSKRAEWVALLSHSRSPIEQGVRIGVAIETQVRDRADQQTTTGEARATSSQR